LNGARIKQENAVFVWWRRGVASRTQENNSLIQTQDAAGQQQRAEANGNPVRQWVHAAPLNGMLTARTANCNSFFAGDSRTPRI
jgi:hypothetical protein